MKKTTKRILGSVLVAKTAIKLGVLALAVIGLSACANITSGIKNSGTAAITSFALPQQRGSTTIRGNDIQLSVPLYLMEKYHYEFKVGAKGEYNGTDNVFEPSATGTVVIGPTDHVPVLYDGTIVDGRPNYILDLNDDWFTGGSTPAQGILNTESVVANPLTGIPERIPDGLVPTISISPGATVIPLTKEYFEQAFSDARLRENVEFWRLSPRRDNAEFLKYMGMDPNFKVPPLTTPIDFRRPVEFIVISSGGKVYTYTVQASGFYSQPFFVKVVPTGRKDGSTWDNAMSLSDALEKPNLYVDYASAKDIWIQGGTYILPDTTYAITQNVNLIGGFTGIESAISPDLDYRARNRAVITYDKAGALKGTNGYMLTIAPPATLITANNVAPVVSLEFVQVSTSITAATPVEADDIARGGIQVGADTADSASTRAYLDGPATLVLKAGSVISGNKIDGNGGGVLVTKGATLIMYAGEIIGNRATGSSGGNGGGVAVNKAKFGMLGGIIASNIADGSGGGVWVDSAASDNVFSKWPLHAPESNYPAVTDPNQSVFWSGIIYGAEGRVPDAPPSNTTILYTQKAEIKVDNIAADGHALKAEYLGTAGTSNVDLKELNDINYEENDASQRTPQDQILQTASTGGGASAGGGGQPAQPSTANQIASWTVQQQRGNSRVQQLYNESFTPPASRPPYARPWNNTTSYSADDRVTFNGNVYKSLTGTGNSDQSPPSDATTVSSYWGYQTPEPDDASKDRHDLGLTVSIGTADVINPLPTLITLADSSSVIFSLKSLLEEGDAVAASGLFGADGTKTVGEIVFNLANWLVLKEHAKVSPKYISALEMESYIKQMDAYDSKKRDYFGAGNTGTGKFGLALQAASKCGCLRDEHRLYQGTGVLCGCRLPEQCAATKCCWTMCAPYRGLQTR